jgi:SulP family sulfate permease
MNDLLPNRKYLSGDLLAGLVNGISNIPDAMATAILAGINPIYGLYAVTVGTSVGSFFTSSHLMAIGATSAIGITVGSALLGYDPGQVPAALFTLTLLVGLIQVLAGVLKLGRLMRYVSNAVMVGFLTGVSLLVVLSQLGDFTGFSSSYSNKVLQAVDLFLHLRQVSAPTLAIGLLTIVLIIWLGRTRLKDFAMLLSILGATAVVFLLGWQDVQLVGDVSDIPRGFPRLSLPDLMLIPGLLMPALSIAIIGLVQGAGVSKGYKNPDGKYPDVSRDFNGQGIANISAGLFQGMPIGGSVGSTALVVSAGGRSRWANIFSGLVVAVVIVLFAGQIGLLAMPALAGLLIVAGFQSLNWAEIHDVWEVGWLPRIVMLATLIATLSLPVQYAVFVGVILSVALNFLSSSRNVRLVELIPTENGLYRVQDAPVVLPSRKVTILQVYGALFFATVEKLVEILPSPAESKNPVVILRLRQHSEITSSFINLLERYDGELLAVDGRLILTGVNLRIKEQLDNTDTIREALGAEDVFLASDLLGESTMEAIRAAEEWLEALHAEDSPRD